MSLLDGLRHRLYVLWRGEWYGREVERELRFHVELERLAASHDHSAADAKLVARRALGNTTYYREEVRRMTPIAWLDHLRQDASYAWRGLRRSPGFTAAVMLTLGLGMGVNAALFSFLDALFERPPQGVVRPNEVKRLYIDVADGGKPGARFATPAFPYPSVRAIVGAESAPVGLAAFTEPDSAAVIDGATRIPIRVSHVSASYFPLLGVKPERGRFFSGDEVRIEAPTPVAVLSDAFWRRAYDASDRVIGRKIDVEARPFTVVGIAAAGFSGVDLDAVDVWLTANTNAYGLAWTGEPWYEGFNDGFQMLARIPAGVSEAGVLSVATRAHLSVHLRGLEYDTTEKVEAGPIVSAAGPANEAQEVTISTRLAGVTLIVLLIAIANVANLLLVRATRRRREIALRRALGVSGGRLYAQLLTESVLLGVLGGAVALLVAFWSGTVLRHLLLPHVQWAAPAIDSRTMLLVATLSVSVGILAGLAPALQSARPNLVDSLKAGSHDGAYQRSTLRSVLLVMQTALSIVLLVGAGLFVRSLRNVRAIDLGYDIDRTVFAAPKFVTRPPATEVYDRLEAVADRLRGTAGVEAVALAWAAPMHGSEYSSMSLPDRDSLPKFNGERGSPMFTVSPGYFRATGIPLVAGRDFTASDRYGAGGAVVVSRTMASVYWPGEPAIGKCLIMGKRTDPCSTVVGVVGNVHRMSVIEKPALQYYVPPTLADTFVMPRELIVRVNEREMGNVSTRVVRELARQFPTMMPATVVTMRQSLESQLRPWRLGAELFTALGILALSVAALGVYSIVAYTVSQRTREMGIRIALGAQRSDVVSLVVGEGTRVLLVGIALGVGIAFVAGWLVASLLYGITPHDLPVFIGSTIALLVVGIAASALPSLRAARVDPVSALRAD
ncbi:MAG TPA: ADOP family duplicated permease [Gemmatimonadaceae bacterium]|nr:ADOP family duplicated permease [Gemmatimonadaceae bacterium]